MKIVLSQMSNKTSNGDAESVVVASLFGNVESDTFGYIDGLNKIETAQFLNSARNVVTFVEQMGKIFAPLKHDMNGNVTKITKTFCEDEVAYKYVDDMILIEKRQGKNVTTDALQWLRRGLHFIARFFALIVDDSEVNRQNLVPLIKNAYEDVLQRYHGWMGVQLFNIMCRFAPNRPELFKILAEGKTHSDEQILREMAIFQKNLLVVIEYLIDFYNQNDLENHAVV